jgi:WD40 repeat protein/transcriptional regulator with XRE-family HTH domain
MKLRRVRGITLTLQGRQRLQASIDKYEYQEKFSEKLTIEDISAHTGLDRRTVSKVLNHEQSIDRRTLERFFKSFALELDASDYTKSDSETDSKNVEHKKERVNHDKAVWSEMPTVPVFHGRTEELTCLEQWLVHDRCQLIALLGMGGMGKTALSVKLVERIEDQFDDFIWCSLRNAPPLREILGIVLQHLSNHQQIELDISQDMNAGISQLIGYFKERRCLVVLDNAEALLRSGDKAGRYREGYEEYGELFRQVGEQRHQSCLILTSREKPKEIGLLEGPLLPVRSFQLSGLSAVEGRELFTIQGAFTGSEEEWSLLIQHYAGNPLALRMVAAAIQELFDGSIPELLEYLKQGILVFDDIRDLLDRQFERLSDLEREIMYWLAIEREPISLQQLKDNILSGVSRQQLPEGLRSLRQRSLIETSAASFTQQPVVMEYMTDRIVENIHKEIVAEQVELLMKYALIKAQAKDYVRESQIRLILKPIAERVGTTLSAKQEAKGKIDKILLNLKKGFSDAPGYGAGNILNLLSQLKIDLTDYDFSNLAVWHADLRAVNLHHVNFTNADLGKSVFTESFGSVLSLSFNPKGTLLATGDTRGEIHLWEVSAFKKMLSLKGHEGWIWSVSFSPGRGASPEETGQMLASSSQDRTIKLWDTHTGQCLKTLQGGDYVTQSVEFSPDGKILASGNRDATVRLWDVRTGECLKTLRGHTQNVWSIAFSPNGRTLASGSLDRTARLWDVHTGKCLQTLSGHTNSVFSVSFSPDGKTLASGSSDRTVRLWNVHTGQCLNTLQGHDDGVWSVAFSPMTGETLASGSDDRTIRLWNAHTGQCLNTLQGHDYSVRSVRFNPVSEASPEGIGQTLASCTGDSQVVKLWDVNSGRCLQILQGYAGWVWSVRFSPNGQMLCGSHDRIVRLWDAHTGQCLQTLSGHTGCVRSVSFSPDGQTLASCSEDQTIKLWDIPTGQCLKTLRSHNCRVFSVSFSPNGQMLASAHNDKTVRLWDIQTGQCLKILSGHTSWVSSVCFSPDGQTLASGSFDHTVRLWDVATGECSKELKGHTGWVWSVRFSPGRGASPKETGQTLASSSEDKTIRLWNVQNGECFQVLKGHNKGVLATSFSPVRGASPEETSRTLATSSEDKTIKVWDIQTGQCIRTLQGHSDEVSAVDFCPIRGASPDETGHLLASGSQDETIKLWDVATGKNLQTLKAESPYESMDITGIRGLSQAQKASLRDLGAIELSALLQKR